MATITATTNFAQARQSTPGMYAVTFAYQYNGQAVAQNDVIILGYIPQDVDVLSGYVWGGESTTGPLTLDLGGAATLSAIASALTVTAGGNPVPWKGPVVFSLSADAEGKLQVPVKVKKTNASATATGSINVTLFLQTRPR